MPRSTQPKLGRPPSTNSTDTRTRILDVARESFAVLGYDVTTNKDLASKAGITTGALYHYFESKAAIYAAVYHDVNEMVFDRFESAVEVHETFRGQLEAVLEEAHRLNVEDPSLARFLGTVRIDAVRHDELRVALSEVRERRSPLIDQMIDVGVSTGEIAPEDRKAVQVVFSIILIGLSDRYSSDVVVHRAAIDAIRGLLEGRLLHPPSSPPSGS